MSETTYRLLADTALKHARAAGDLLLGARNEVRQVDTKSTPTDVVTDMDRASERLLVEEIRASHPDDGILGEEGAERTGSSGFRWVIDPLDGTVNYLYGLPGWAVSVGVEFDGEAVAGAVVVPVLGEAYTAWSGGGAWQHRDGRALPIHASAETDLSRALIGTGFAYDSSVRSWQGSWVAEVVARVRDIRRAGAAAVDLCMVACGSLDGYYESGLQPWDLCAGGLIAREAGAVVSGLHGRAAGREDVVAAAPGIHQRLVALLETLEER